MLALPLRILKRAHYATFDRDGNMSIYSNGSDKQSSSIAAYSATNLDYTHDARLGARHEVGDEQYLTGSIDETRISAVVRDDNWITTAYNNQSDPTDDSVFWGTLGTEQSN